MRIVDHAEERLVGGRRGEQPERRGIGGETIGVLDLLERERRLDRIRLRRRQLVEQSEHRAHELVQRCERELGLGLDPERVQLTKVFRSLDRVLQQCRLSHACFSTQNERPAAALASIH